MKQESVLLLTPFENCSSHKLAKRISSGLVLTVPFDICFYQPLQKIFPKVILYDYLKEMIEKGIWDMNEDVVDLVKKQKPKYILWVAYGEYYEVMESTFEKIRREGVKVIGWFLDDEVRFDYYSKWWIPYVDYFITNDFEAVDKYKALGAWATQATCTAQAIERDWTNLQMKYDVSFVGSIRADREQYINALKGKNMPIRLFGESGGKFVSHQEMLDIFWNSKINLNFSRTYKDMKLGIKARIFEVCLAGGFLLTEYVPGIERFYEIDKEIVCFRNPEEMIDKIAYYLNHEDERRIIAHAGWERARKEHSCLQVMSRVFNEVVLAKQSDVAENKRVIKKPLKIRRRISNFYSEWGAAFSEENYKGLWKDALELSIRYNPMNIKALYHYLLGFLSFMQRVKILNLYRNIRSRLVRQ